MNSVQTSVTVTAKVVDEVSSGVIATTATTAIEAVSESVSDPSWWQTIIQFLSSLFS